MPKQLCNWSDLVPFGVNYLTGEADPYGQRLLCDLSEKGVERMRDFLGLHYEAKFADNWNSAVGEVPAVASVMLPREVFSTLATFLLFSVDGYDIVMRHHGSVVGYRQQDVDGFYPSALAAIETQGAEVHHNPRHGTRNQHMMTGRFA